MNHKFAEKNLLLKEFDNVSMFKVYLLCKAIELAT